MTQEILQALRNIEDKIMAAPRPCTCHPDDNPPRPCAQRYALSECRAAVTPTAFEWTPSMDAIWPKDMRPTMSGLLAIWAAMHEAAVYGEADASASRKPLADDGWIEWGGGECPVKTGTRILARLRNGTESLDDDGTGFLGDHESGFGASWWKPQGAWYDIVAYKVLP